MPHQLSDSRRANLAAETLYNAFCDYRRRFNAVTEQAPRRFEQRDWRGAQADASQRLTLYTENVRDSLEQIKEYLGLKLHDKLIWVSMKAVYSSYTEHLDDWDLAETFFNSVTRRVFTTVGVDPQIEFVASDFAVPPTLSVTSPHHVYKYIPDAETLVRTLLADYAFGAPFEDFERDVALVTDRLEHHLAEFGVSGNLLGADMVKPVFYRGKGAYIVGELICAQVRTPLILALVHPDTGIRIDAVLTGEDDAHILFSFTRSYFRVMVERPYDLVEFLSKLMPRKHRAELYISLGFNKHGKTEMYRALLEHLETTTQQFRVARGQKGMVMTVFDMPNYDQIFKLIKDRFDPPKSVSRREVMSKYDLVFKHDRAGRLIDAQAFEFLEFDRRHFSDELLEELLGVAGNTVRVEGDTVIIDHAYIERRITPLDLYVKEMPRESAEAALIDYGHAIKDLARSNIFPGDMLLKNFGVTRHGRVVFYDYDELTFLTDCNFRRFPEPQTFEQEMASEPWYYVAENDIFPEELLRFLGIPNHLKSVFVEHHSDLLDVVFWQEVQEKLEQGVITDILPYHQDQRLQPPRALA